MAGLSLFSGVLALAIALIVQSTGSSHNVQSACDDPFRDAGSLRFSTDFWEKTDFCLHSVSYDEIRSGGPPPDGIPPIYEPQFESIAQASNWLQPQSPVIALFRSGEAKAYPLAILIWHEIANDEIDGVPVAVTFCPLCNSAIVFDRRIGDQTLTFGVSGNLRNSDMIMWDHETQSWWQQFTGEGIVGQFTGEELTFLPSQIVGFGDFAAEFPEGQVLSRSTGASRAYGNNPYAGYDSSAQPFLFEGETDPRLPATEHVLAGIIGQQAVAYPFAVLSDQKVINDVVDGTPVAAFWQDGVVSALDAAEIDQSRDIGTAALYNRELDGLTLTFSAGADDVIRDDQTGSTWNVFGRAIAGQLVGSQLRQRLAAPHFWFAWAAFQPDTMVYGS